MLCLPEQMCSRCSTSNAIAARDLRYAGHNCNVRFVDDASGGLSCIRLDDNAFDRIVSFLKNGVRTPMAG